MVTSPDSSAPKNFIMYSIVLEGFSGSSYSFTKIFDIWSMAKVFSRYTLNYSFLDYIPCDIISCIIYVLNSILFSLSSTPFFNLYILVYTGIHFISTSIFQPCIQFFLWTIWIYLKLIKKENLFPMLCMNFSDVRCIF